MSPQHIAIAVRQRTAMAQASEDSSPYLDRVRPTRKIIEALISTREIELAKANTVPQRRRVERDLSFLRDELARLDGPAEPGAAN